MNIRTFSDLYESQSCNNEQVRLLQILFCTLSVGSLESAFPFFWNYCLPYSSSNKARSGHKFVQQCLDGCHPDCKHIEGDVCHSHRLTYFGDTHVLLKCAADELEYITKDPGTVFFQALQFGCNLLWREIISSKTTQAWHNHGNRYQDIRWGDQPCCCIEWWLKAM